MKTLVGLAVLVASSHILVWGSVDLAKALGVSDLLIGLTIVAAGTSLPELASAVASARRGENEFVLGNIVGSNLFNTLAVVGIAGAICPIRDFSPYILTRDLPLMGLASASILLFGANKRKPRENGSVSRGVCATDVDGCLTDVVERTKIEKKGDTIVFTEDGVDTPLEPNTPVSMNMWGFTPEYFQYSEDAFRKFLQEKGQELKSEFYIPTLVNDLILAGKASCRVLDTPSKWFGVTYSEDRPAVVAKIQQLIDAGEYPAKLF